MSKRKGRRRPLTSEIKSVLRPPSDDEAELESPASGTEPGAEHAPLHEFEPGMSEPPSERDQESSLLDVSSDLGPIELAPSEPELAEKPARGRRLHAVKALKNIAVVDAASESEDPLIFPAGAALGLADGSDAEDALDADDAERPELPPFPLDGIDADDTEGFLRGLIEALLFTSQKPLPLKDIARSAGLDRLRAKELVDQLTDSYAGRGLCIEEVAGGFVMRSSPRYAPYIQKLLALRPIRLSRAQLETLAIIAYRQPVTKPEVDDIRGVDSGQVIKGLLERALLKILGKKDEPGRPMLYGTTNDFLELLNLQSLKDLPTLREYTELSEDSQRKFMEETGEAAPSGAAVGESFVAGMGEGDGASLGTFERAVPTAAEAELESLGDAAAGVDAPEDAVDLSDIFDDGLLERPAVNTMGSDGKRVDIEDGPPPEARAEAGESEEDADESDADESDDDDDDADDDDDDDDDADDDDDKPEKD